MKLIHTLLLSLVLTSAALIYMFLNFGGEAPKELRGPLDNDLAIPESPSPSSAAGTLEYVVPLDENGPVTEKPEIYWIESSDMLGASSDGERAELDPSWRMTGLWMPEDSPIAKSLWVPVVAHDLAEGEMILVDLQNYEAIGPKVEREGLQWLLGLDGLKLTSRQWILDSLVFAEWYETVLSEGNHLRFIVLRKSGSTHVGVDGIDSLRRGSYSLADGSRFDSVRITHLNTRDSCHLIGYLKCANAAGESKFEHLELPTCDYTQVDTAAVATKLMQMKCLHLRTN